MVPKDAHGSMGKTRIGYGILRAMKSAALLAFFVTFPAFGFGNNSLSVTPNCNFATLANPVSKALVSSGKAGAFRGTLQVHPGGSNSLHRVEAYNDQGQLVGNIKYDLVSDGKMVVRFTFIEKDYRQFGLNKTLLLRALELHPEITSVKSELRGDNGEIYWQQIQEGKSISEAIRATPAYKIMPSDFEIDWKQSEIASDRVLDEDGDPPNIVLVMKKRSK
jgi:hypothetical protein